MSVDVRYMEHKRSDFDGLLGHPTTNIPPPNALGASNLSALCENIWLCSYVDIHYFWAIFHSMAISGTILLEVPYILHIFNIWPCSWISGDISPVSMAVYGKNYPQNWGPETPIGTWIDLHSFRMRISKEVVPTIARCRFIGPIAVNSYGLWGIYLYYSLPFMGLTLNQHNHWYRHPK